MTMEVISFSPNKQYKLPVLHVSQAKRQAIAPIKKVEFSQALPRTTTRQVFREGHLSLHSQHALIAYKSLQVSQQHDALHQLLGIDVFA